MENNIILFLDALDNFLKKQDLEVWSHTEHDKCIELFPEGTKFNA